MKYMLMMRASDEAMAAFQDAEMDFDEVIEVMGRFIDETIRAGVLVAAEEPLGGYRILDVASIDEAVEWAKGAPWRDRA